MTCPYRRCARCRRSKRPTRHSHRGISYIDVQAPRNVENIVLAADKDLEAIGTSSTTRSRQPGCQPPEGRRRGRPMDGGAGGDTYLFDLGDGSDTIVESATGRGPPPSTPCSSARHCASDIAVARVGLDAVLSPCRTAAKVVVQGWFGAAPGPARTDRVRGRHVLERCADGRAHAQHRRHGRCGHPARRRRRRSAWRAAAATITWMAAPAAIQPSSAAGSRTTPCWPYQGLLYVGDTVAGRDGIDRLIGVEKLVFAQSPGTVYRGKQSQVRQPAGIRRVVSRPDRCFRRQPDRGYRALRAAGRCRGTARQLRRPELPRLLCRSEQYVRRGCRGGRRATTSRTGRAQGRTVRIAAQDVVDAQGVHSYVQRGTDGGDAMRSLGAGAPTPCRAWAAATR